MRTITCEELRQKLTRNDPAFKIVNALEPEKFRLKHIPRSINVFTREEILSQLDKNDDIVVYCTDKYCNKSIMLYYLLEALGYSNIARFPGGLLEWEQAGLPMETYSAEFKIIQ